jgi:hypothetical protein
MAQIPTASAQLRSKPIPQCEPTPVKLLSEIVDLEDAKDAEDQQIEIGVLPLNPLKSISISGYKLPKDVTAGLMMTMNLSQCRIVSTLSAIYYISSSRQLPISPDQLRTPRTPN